MLQYLNKDRDMLYKIKANFHKNLLLEFFIKLTDGTIEKQKPDGLEILKSIKKAKITAANTLEWYEHCLCEIPLNHERETVYNRYFYDFSISLVLEEKDDIHGDSFWEYLHKR